VGRGWGASGRWWRAAAGAGRAGEGRGKRRPAAAGSRGPPAARAARATRAATRAAGARPSCIRTCMALRSGAARRTDVVLQGGSARSARDCRPRRVSYLMAPRPQPSAGAGQSTTGLGAAGARRFVSANGGVWASLWCGFECWAMVWMKERRAHGGWRMAGCVDSGAPRAAAADGLSICGELA
jgi:hypothetical protein